MKIVLAGGGTGGHLFPGIAIAEEVRRRSEPPEVIFIGTEKGIEASIVPREGYPIRYLNAEGVVGKSLMKKVAPSQDFLPQETTPADGRRIRTTMFLQERLLPMPSTPGG